MITYRVNFNEDLENEGWQTLFVPSTIEFTHEEVEPYEGEYTIHPNTQGAFEAHLNNSLIVGAYDIVADEKESVKVYGLNGSDITIMQNSEGFWYCVSGTDKGNYWESEDIGSFRTQAEAEADVPEYFNRFNEQAQTRY